MREICVDSKGIRMAKKPHVIEIYNCNNIISASISIIPDSLNIKYAINGTGKSTIAKAINLGSKNDSLKPLVPFGAMDSKDAQKQPRISELPFSNVMTFNED